METQRFGFKAKNYDVNPPLYFVVFAVVWQLLSLIRNDSGEFSSFVFPYYFSLEHIKSYNLNFL